MTENKEAELKDLMDRLDKISPDQLRQVDKDVDHFVKTFGNSIHEHAEQHKLEYSLLDKTILLCYTDVICIKHAEENNDDILGGLVCIGDHEHLLMLYKAIGEKLKEKGILNDDEER